MSGHRKEFLKYYREKLNYALTEVERLRKLMEEHVDCQPSECEKCPWNDYGICLVRPEKSRW